MRWLSVMKSEKNLPRHFPNCVKKWISPDTPEVFSVLGNFRINRVGWIFGKFPDIWCFCKFSYHIFILPIDRYGGVFQPPIFSVLTRPAFLWLITRVALGVWITYGQRMTLQLRPSDPFWQNFNQTELNKPPIPNQWPIFRENELTATPENRDFGNIWANFENNLGRLYSFDCYEIRSLHERIGWGHLRPQQDS